MVHVSGHAAAGELLYLYNMVKPANVMPVHGEVRHLHANARLAVKTGVDPQQVIIAADGTVVDLVDGKASIVGEVPCGYVYVDGASVGTSPRVVEGSAHPGRRGVHLGGGRGGPRRGEDPGWPGDPRARVRGLRCRVRRGDPDHRGETDRCDQRWGDRSACTGADRAPHSAAGSMPSTAAAR